MNPDGLSAKDYDKFNESLSKFINFVFDEFALSRMENNKFGGFEIYNSKFINDPSISEFISKLADSTISQKLINGIFKD